MKKIILVSMLAVLFFGVTLARAEKHLFYQRSIQSIDAPTVTVVNTFKKSAVIEWTAIDQAEMYSIRLMNAAGQKKRIIKTTDTQKTIKKLTPGRTYQVRVRAIVNDEKGTASETVSFTTQTASTPQTFSVSISDFAFENGTITITVGDTVQWTNIDAFTHTVTSDSGSELNSDDLENGGTYEHTFTSAGTYSYHCTYHPSMTGVITVQ